MAERINETKGLVTMKNLLRFTPAKALTLSFLGFVGMGLSFWQFTGFQHQIQTISTLQIGIATCSQRISQTFTAMALKDINSSYLNQNFMALSDECLQEVLKQVDQKSILTLKADQVLRELISKVHWFHEKVVSLHAPLIAKAKVEMDFEGLNDKFSQFENAKMELQDQLDIVTQNIKVVIANYELALMFSLILFLGSFFIVLMYNLDLNRKYKSIEQRALQILNSGDAKISSFVDRLIKEALGLSQLSVTKQIFTQYHQEIIEQKEKVSIPHAKMSNAEQKMLEKAQAQFEEMGEDFNAEVDQADDASILQVMNAIETIRGKEYFSISDLRDCRVQVASEMMEQVIFHLTQFLGDKNNHSEKKIYLSNQIHSDKVILNFFIKQSAFSADELEFMDAKSSLEMDNVSLKLFKEMIKDNSHIKWHFENKVDRIGKISGATVRLVINRVPKLKTRKLLSVVKAKKKDISRDNFVN